MAETKRGRFGSNLGIILATAGSAVGLGNIWRFPYMTGMNGGAAFIIIYIVCVFALGIPGMVAEFVVGRSRMLQEPTTNLLVARHGVSLATLVSSLR